MDERTDVLIMPDLVNGDAPVFDDLLRRYEKPIYNFIYRQVFHREDARDLTQETFLKIYKFRSSYDATKKFSTWAYTIATRTLYDWWRKKQRTITTTDLEDASSGGLDPETITLPSAYNSIESKIDVEQALAKLKPIHSTILLLYYQRGFLYQEIAEALNIPVNTVKPHLYRAKKALRERLQNAYGRQ